MIHTKIKGIGFTSGKADYIQRKVGDKYEKVCLCEHNIDLSSGCPSNTPPGKKRNSTEYNCTYCYARRTNYNNPRAYSIDEKKLEKQIEEYGIKIIRIGKTVECGYKGSRKGLINILEICEKHNVQAIMPTKFLEYNKEIARLFKETNSALFYSIGNDKFEKGACLHGFNNKYRLEQAKRYLKEDINVGLKIVTDLTVSPDDAEKRGWFAKKALLNFPKERIELIPLRIKAKRFAADAIGEHWNTLQQKINLEEFLLPIHSVERPERYVMEESITILIPNYIDKSFSYFTKRNQLCGHMGTRENGIVYCDKCLLKDEKGKKIEAVSFPMSELLPPPKQTIPKRAWRFDRVIESRTSKKQQMVLNL